MTIDIKELRDLHAKTTQGTWEKGSHTHDGWVVYSAGRRSMLASDMSTHNAEFIVEAHAHWNALLDELTEARKLLADVHKAVARGDHGPIGNAECIIDAIVSARIGSDEETERADVAEAELESLRAEVARLRTALLCVHRQLASEEEQLRLALAEAQADALAHRLRCEQLEAQLEERKRAEVASDQRAKVAEERARIGKQYLLRQASSGDLPISVRVNARFALDAIAKVKP